MVKLASPARSRPSARFASAYRTTSDKDLLQREILQMLQELKKKKKRNLTRRGEKKTKFDPGRKR